MKFFSTLLIGMLIIFYTSNNANSQSNVNKPLRAIRFVDFSKPANVPFFRRNQELSKLVIEAIQSGKLEAYYVNYKDNAIATKLTLDGFIERISVKVKLVIEGIEIDNYEQYFPRDFFIMGIDQTYWKEREIEYTQVNYINFYIQDYETKKHSYKFSIKWSDFISLLNEHKELLYSTNSYGTWWRGNVFLTNEYYAIDAGMGGDFINLAKRGVYLPSTDYRKNIPYSLEKYKDTIYRGFPLDIYVSEEKRNESYEIDKFIIEEIPHWYVYANGNRFSFEWKDFLKIAEDSSWRKKSEVYTLADAFMLRKFSYTTNNDIIISKDGKFIKGGKDLLCTNELTNSFHLETPHRYKQFYVNSVEGLYLGDSLNLHLHKPGHSLVELAYEYVTSGKVSIYYDDSMSTPLTIEEFLHNTSKDVMAYEFDNSQTYNKGDTISINRFYYILQKDVKPYEYNTADEIKNIIEPYFTQPYNPLEFLPLELVQKISFDNEGNNKKYEFKGIGLKVPCYLTKRKIEYPIGYINWEDIKSVLLSDPRAVVEYKGKKANLVELMENRQFFSAFYKTDMIKPNR